MIRTTGGKIQPDHVCLKGASMANQEHHADLKTIGTKRIVERCREVFRQKENLEYYADEDLKNAERKYIKFCLMGKTC